MDLKPNGSSRDDEKERVYFSFNYNNIRNLQDISFQRFGIIPCFHDLKDGFNVLHLQCFGLLPRDAAGAADGVFDLEKRSGVSLMLRGMREW